MYAWFLYHYVKETRPATMNNRIEISTVVTVQKVEGCSFALNCDGECDNGSASAGDSEGIAVKFILLNHILTKIL